MVLCKFDTSAGRGANYIDLRKDSDPSMGAPGIEATILSELVELLVNHPGGLRRWSVMRAIRDNRSRASRPMSLKFEIEIERVFRGCCSNCGELNRDPESALFYRPADKAGEVWAVHLERARAWLSKAARYQHQTS
jgi:hypothetical protein